MIDAHQHFWRIARGDYRWMTPGLAAIRRDYLPEDLEPLLLEAGITSTILVQATETDAETDFLLSLAAEAPFVAGVVGWVDLEARTAAPRIRRLAREPGFVGVRPMIQDQPDPEWILRPGLDPAITALVEEGLALDALVRLQHLRPLHAFLVRHPGLRAVIDHAAKPVVATGMKPWGGFPAWRAGMQAIARDSAAWCKFSGLATEAKGDWNPWDMRPYLDVLLESFGPQRIVWGSDWPVVELAGGDAAWWDATQKLLADLPEEHREAILGENARRLYALHDRGLA